jgi:dephospho-CoA kinase
MLTIGITGGIGSGKSTVCRAFKVLGVPVFQADAVAAWLQNNDLSIKKEIIGLFGAEIYGSDGLLIRRKMAAIIFSDRLLLEKMNQLIHPAVHREFEKWKVQMKHPPYVLYEAAILFETGNFRSFDYTVLVLADEKERIERVIKRDHSSVEAIMQRMHNQMPDTEKMRLADFIIENNDDQMILPQVLKLDQILKSKNHVWKIDR